MILIVKDLHVEVEGKEILKGVNLEVYEGSIHALMGPNGSGKSTLAQTIAGHPLYKVTKGSIIFQGKDITKLSPDKRARLGMFLAFQYPSAVPGVTMLDLLRSAINARKPEGEKIHMLKDPAGVAAKLELLGLDKSFLDRPVNEGLSGGEKKRAEVLQLAVLEPLLAIMDETDSGLDIDALKTVAEGVTKVKSDKQAILLITHYQRILQYIRPDEVHVMVAGKIITSGGSELAERLEQEGYEKIIKEHT